MKILVVFTGGTIGCTSGDTVSLDENVSERLLGECRSLFWDYEFTAAYPLRTLSENMNLAKWGALLKFLKSEDLSRFDGVIITHGTDTLSYTSSFLGLTIADTPIPVVLTGSNRPLGDEDSNALDNLFAAVMLIEKRIKGVFVAYKNHRYADYYHACNLREADGLTDCFSGDTFGFCNGEAADIVHSRAPYLPYHIGLFTLDKSIMLIKPYPNINYDCLCPDNSAAVLHLLYHSATACTEGESLSFCRFAERCAKKGIPVYAAPFKRNALPYSTTAELLAAGVIPLYEMSTETAYALLVAAFNQHDMTTAAFIRRINRC